MVKQSIEERRRASRAERILSIQYRLVKSKWKNSDTRWHLSTTHDMSLLGLSFLSDVEYRVDDVLELNVVMSGILDVFKGYGQVVRIEKKATGSFCFIAVKFVKGPLARKKIEAARRTRRIK